MSKKERHFKYSSSPEVVYLEKKVKNEINVFVSQRDNATGGVGKVSVITHKHAKPCMLEVEGQGYTWAS